MPPASFFTAELVAKRMQLLREVVPAANRIAVFVNPTDAENYQSTLRELEAAVGGRQILVREVTTGREIDEAFASIAHEKADALFVAPGSFFNTRRVQLAVLAARHALPAIYAARLCRSWRADELRHRYPRRLSSSRSLYRAYPQGHQAGGLTGGAVDQVRANLPVVQSSRFEFVINLKTANALGLEVPPTLLARADEVIE
jgi:putative tryptophan/tyrosine transport system substrate-binding protein